MTNITSPLNQPKSTAGTLDYASTAGRPNPIVQSLLGPAGRALLALIFVLLLGCVFNADGAFFKFGTHRDALRSISEYGILACGMTLVIISGGIDLAVGSVLAVVAVAFARMTIHWGWSAAYAIPLCLLLGAGCGLISGVLTASLRIQAFIATLAMMVFARGLAKTFGGGTTVSTAVQHADGTYEYVKEPRIFSLIDMRVLGGNVAVVTLIFIVCALICWLMLSKHRWGRQLYAVGGNQEAARLSGVPVQWVTTLAYVASGLLAGVAGVCHAAQDKQGHPQAGETYELTAIAMVVIGGTSLAGGRGGLGLTLLGALTIGYLEKILSLNAVPDSRRLMLTGFIIVIAVLAQRRSRR